MSTRTSPWGTKIREVVPTNPWGTPREPMLRDFTEVGLSEAAGTTALEGLRDGEYLSFEDACLSQAVFSEVADAPTLDEALMRDKARAFSRLAEVDS